MHTLLIHQAFGSPNDAGGTRHFELAQFIIRNQHQFSVVTSNISYLSGKPTSDANALVAEEIIDGVRVLRAYTYPSLHRSFVWRVVSFLSFMLTSIWAGFKAGQVDLVMGTTPPIFQAISAWLIAKLRRCPFLLEVRDLWPDFAIELGVLHNPLLIQLSRWLEKFLYQQADHILVNSPAYRDYLLGKGIAAQKISLIPNGVDVSMFDPTNTGKDFRQKWGLESLFVVTYAGALGLANDIPTVLRAAKRLQKESSIRFLLVGDGKERANLEALSKELGLTNVLFTGPQPKTQMPSVLAASNVCLATLQNIPMFKTTYPNKIFDYMAAGRPTVLAIDGVIREVIEAANGGVFVTPGDDLRLAEAILTLYQNPTQIQSMGVAARNYVVKHFNRNEQAQNFCNLIVNLAKIR